MKEEEEVAGEMSSRRQMAVCQSRRPGRKPKLFNRYGPRRRQESPQTVGVASLLPEAMGWATELSRLSAPTTSIAMPCSAAAVRLIMMMMMMMMMIMMNRAITHKEEAEGRENEPQRIL